MNKEKLQQAKDAFEEYKKNKKEIIDNNLPLPGIKTQKAYYVLTGILLRAITLFGREHISYLNDKKIITPKGRPIIFANTHKFKPDVEKIAISIRQPSAIIASDFINSYKTVGGWYFNTRPVVFVDPYSKEDKGYSYKMMVRYLKEGYNFMIYPEAVWNLSENKIVLDIFFGTVKAALESNAVIVCTSIERYGKEYIINRKGYFDPGDILKKYTELPFEKLCADAESSWLVKDILIECNQKLRDIMATNTYEIWEDHANKFGIERRENLCEDYWERFVLKLTSEWPGYKMSDNVEQRYHSKEEITQEQIDEDLKKVRPTRQNAFLFNKRLKG